ncbi:spermidine/putrescine ABC transporter ATP-binding protein [Candidatus Desantisbacteria bacterium CG1_02_38_46]|uniref:Spermidine/putrescine import ATP-binding protein PotA n=3 Tax=unclassified Candidatus Desantisiibacteriota TaxID=3106372 RepID=A0A2H9PEG8_9BACT|nr:MAG: spermidine/putrescine ABC transporter ATP-binding protein [Candidatus Desantisbacteria bacterium CG1_02_38_46]PIU52128.1 MAG: spermidine/putrescine ABC transporter ATP-binding protein [Candidatus Desantisbacteria bacterium CG07_land_8_20_14_0_80_39_15]PIZ17223.1 MAG: spermidine/putrescine ABC transporter ATP-binding protein [Candidatus Desantisbacteria bacterium CG_4_10_14_0_8_um_filter_39_17]
MVSVKLQGITKYFDKTRAVDNVSLEIKKGELFFLLGPSGCGKTTVLRMIAGFYTPENGEICFDDKLMNEVPPHKRNTGMVFQNYALWPHMTVKKNVEYGLDIRDVSLEEKEARTNQALEIVRMIDYANRKPAQLSGGQQQRVALARALVIQPDLLLLDEPLSNLDAKLRLEMREEIKRIHEETKITSIYVTHDQKEALSMAERVAVMNTGMIEQTGTPREIYENPANKFVAGFIGETNFIEGKVLETNNHKVILEIRIGKLCSFNKINIQIGGRVACSIRPESIQVLDAINETLPNQFEAVIEEFTYLGDNEQYHLRLGDNSLIKAVAHNPFGQVRQKGSKVWIYIEPQNVILLL